MRAARRLTHVRDEAIDAGTPETVEAIRRQLEPADAALVSVLAYEGLRPGEAFALQWRDVDDDRGRARPRLLVQRAVSGEQLSTTKSQRARQPELFAPVTKELGDLYVAAGRPSPFTLVFGDSEGGYHRRQNRRRRVWIPALRARRHRLLPHLRPPPHLRDPADLRRPHGQRGRRPPRPRRPRLHGPHLRARHA